MVGGGSTNCKRNTLTDKNKMMDKLLQQEKVLRRSLEGLTRELGQANKGIVEREGEIQELGRGCTSFLGKMEAWRVAVAAGEGSKQTDSNDITNQCRNRMELRKTSEMGRGRDAVFILPEEIWGIIFDNLSDWRDLRNCSKTCVLFEKILHPSKPTYLFKQVFPHIFKHLPLNDILYSRVVSKTWHEVIDGFFENHPSLQPHDDNRVDPRNPPFANPIKEKKMDKMFRLFRNNLSGYQCPYPFIGRSKAIMIGFNNQIEWEERMEIRFWNSLYKFLEVNGQHIWYFTVFLLQRDEYPRKKQRILFQFLTVDIFRLVPNLRKLHICGYLSQFQTFPDTPSTFAKPTASNLETLQVDIIRDRWEEGQTEVDAQEPHLIIDILLNTYHAQLRKLHVDATTWTSMFHLEWRSLVELHVEDLSIKDVPCLQIKLPNLRKLGLSLKSRDPWTFDKFLEFINNVANANPLLNTLRLGGSWITREFVNSLPPSNLYGPPSLRTLELEHVVSPNSSTCYDFLLRFPFLENVNVFWRKIPRRGGNNMEVRSEIELQPWTGFEYDRSSRIDEEEGRLEILQVKKFMYEEGGMGLYKSNIWELLPKLKVFTFQQDLYTRGGYENFMEKRKALQSSPEFAN